MVPPLLPSLLHDDPIDIKKEARPVVGLFRPGWLSHLGRLLFDDPRSRRGAASVSNSGTSEFWGSLQ